mgnify:CR=1 FL=1
MNKLTIAELASYYNDNYYDNILISSVRGYTVKIHWKVFTRRYKDAMSHPRPLTPKYVYGIRPTLWVPYHNNGFWI